MPVLFSTEPVCHGPTEAVRVGDATLIRTPVEQWAYATSYPRIGKFEGDGALIVRVVVHVTRGAIGVGCLNEQRTEFLDEVFAGVSPAPVTLEVVASEASIVGEIVVRNVSDDGPSEARVEITGCSIVGAVDQIRDPPLSHPRPMTRWSRYYGGNGETAIERIRAGWFDRLQHPSTVSWIDGIQLVVRPGDQLSRALYISGTYEPNTLAILRLLTPPDGVFVDIGANAGVVSVAAARWVGAGGRVFAFEPSQREYDRLLENLQLNGLGQVTPVQAAVSDVEGNVDLRVAENGFGGLNTLASSFPYAGVKMAAIERVPAVTLDGFFSRAPTSRIDVMKIDVEGAEGAVLMGAQRMLRDYRPALVAEVFSRSLQSTGWDRARLAALFADAGYELFAIEDGTAKLNALKSLDSVDEQNVVALPNERRAVLVRRLQEGR